MSNFSNFFTARIVDRVREKNIEEGRIKGDRFTIDQFECAGDTYAPVFVVCGILLVVITGICAICWIRGSEDADIATWFFGVITLLVFFAGWAAAHQRLVVDGNDATYVNVWGIKKKFQFSDVTVCLTTEQFRRLYIGSKKVATLDKDMYCLELLEARCDKEGIVWRDKGRTGITKLSLVWNATRTVGLIFFWLAVGLTIFMIPLRIHYVGFDPADIVFMLELTLYIWGFCGVSVLMMMLLFAPGLIQVFAIERALGLSFRQEMMVRGARGREYQDHEWFVESIPGKIEVLNRRFIGQWHGIVAERVSGRIMYHVEFTDINGKKRRVGGHYGEYAEKMNKWYFGA